MRRHWVAKPDAAYFEGFSLHTGVHLHVNDREGLANLCGYGARPALSQERLSALSDGRLSLRLKRPMDGRAAIELTPTPPISPPAEPAACAVEAPSPSERLRRPDAQIPWAELLRRVFRLGVLACPCGGRRKVLGFIIDRKVAKSILESMDLPTTAPPLAPARLRHEPGVELWQDDVPELQSLR